MKCKLQAWLLYIMTVRLWCEVWDLKFWNVSVLTALWMSMRFECHMRWLANVTWNDCVNDRSGSVCLDVINQSWSPMYDLTNIFEVFLPQLLTYPNPTDPLNGEAAALQMREPERYRQKVIEYVRKYAKPEDFPTSTSAGDQEDEDENGSDFSMSDSENDDDGDDDIANQITLHEDLDAAANRTSSRTDGAGSSARGGLAENGGFAGSHSGNGMGGAWSRWWRLNDKRWIWRQAWVTSIRAKFYFLLLFFFKLMVAGGGMQNACDRRGDG